MGLERQQFLIYLTPAGNNSIIPVGFLFKEISPNFFVVPIKTATSISGMMQSKLQRANREIGKEGSATENSKLEVIIEIIAN